MLGSPSAAWASVEASIRSCVPQAASYHKVNPHVLRAVINIESGGRNTISRNGNGTIDIGVAQINSIHMPELKKHGVTVETLMDPCASIYVAAWKISKLISRDGNTWSAVAKYHSATPCRNFGYQVRLMNELRRMEVLGGPLEREPSC